MFAIVKKMFKAQEKITESRLEILELEQKQKASEKRIKEIDRKIDLITNKNVNL